MNRYYHTHNGKDAEKVEFDNLKDKTLIITHTLVGSDAATAANYGVFFVSPVDGYVNRVLEAHATAGTDGSAVSLNIEKLEDGEALGSGDEVLETDLSLKATANTTQYGTINYIRANSALNVGDRLALKDTGTLTSVDTVTVTVEIIY